MLWRGAIARDPDRPIARGSPPKPKVSIEHSKRCAVRSGGARCDAHRLVGYEPDWASAAGADSETYGGCETAAGVDSPGPRAAVHWIGWDVGDDAGPPSGEGQWKEGSCL